MFKKIKKNAFNVTVMLLTIVTVVTLSLLSVSFSTIYYILIFGSVGLVIYLIGYFKSRQIGREEEK